MECKSKNRNNKVILRGAIDLKANKSTSLKTDFIRLYTWRDSLYNYKKDDKECNFSPNMQNLIIESWLQGLNYP